MSCSLIRSDGPATSSAATSSLLASPVASPASHEDTEVRAADVEAALQAEAEAEAEAEATEAEAAEAAGRREREATAGTAELKRALECEREDVSAVDARPSVRA